MMILLLLQVATTAATPEPPGRIDLLAAAESRCAGHEQDIVVCGRRNGHRLPRLPDQPEARAIPPAVVTLPGGGTGNVHVEQATIAQTGETTKRIMLGTSFPF